VKRILRCCRKNDRIVLQRHYLEGYRVQEIASQHGWTETAVRIRLLRARRSAGKRLGINHAERSAAEEAAPIAA